MAACLPTADMCLTGRPPDLGEGSLGCNDSAFGRIPPLQMGEDMETSGMVLSEYLADVVMGWAG